MQRSKLVLGLVVALGVGALGAVAVGMENDSGGSGSIGSASVTTIAVDPSTTTSTTEAPNVTLAPVTDPATTPTDGTDAGDGGVARSIDGCDGMTYANHGDDVSAVAHDPGRQPGDVPAAAQSDCGKPIPSAGAGGSGETSTPDTEAPDVGEGTDSPGQGIGHGKSGK